MDFFNAQCPSSSAMFYMLLHVYMDFIPFQVRKVQKVTHSVRNNINDVLRDIHLVVVNLISLKRTPLIEF